MAGSNIKKKHILREVKSSQIQSAVLIFIELELLDTRHPQICVPSLGLALYATRFSNLENLELPNPKVY